MTEVRLASGAKIDWKNPPKPNQICSLVIDGRKVKAGFRTLCHMNRLDYRATKQFGVGITVFQTPFSTSCAASVGTHDYDDVWDLWIHGVSAWDQQRYFRKSGFACWYRHAPLFSNHIHGFTLPPNYGGPVADDFKQAGIKVGKYVDGGFSTQGSLVTSSQIVDYYSRAFGLSGKHGKGSDTSWFPQDIRATIFDLGGYVKQRAAA
jgi:hypothetical protein